MSDKKTDWERRLLKVLLPIITSEEELTLEALKEADYPGDENQLLEDLHILESYGMIKKSSVGGGFVTKRPGQTVDRFTCSVEHIGEDAAYLRLRGETDGELRDFGLEYPLHELKSQIPNVSKGMMLKCAVKDNMKEVSLHFKPFTPQPLPLEKRQAIQKKYDEIFKDLDDGFVKK